MTDSDQILIRYLLGELSDAESSALEQEYFADRLLFDRVVAAESELVDDYARGSLAPARRDRFQNYYLAHPERLERAKFAQALKTRLDQVQQITASTDRPESWWRRFLSGMAGSRLAWGLAAAVLLLVIGGVWFAIETRRLNQELARNESERGRQQQRERELEQQVSGERARADQLASELERLRETQQSAGPTPTPRNPSAYATLILAIGGVRGAETGPPGKIVLAPGTEKALIQLNLRDNDYSKYSVVIQSADGKQIFKRDGLQSRNKSHVILSVIVPASKLSNGDYILTLKGITSSGEVEDVSKSLFRVERK